MASALQAIFVAVAGIIALWYSGKSVIVLRKLQEAAHGKKGCVPAPDVGNVTIHYFGGRGRAEPFRLLLEETHINYKEVNFDKDSWPAHKKEGTESGFFTYGQVPAIETTSGVRLVQSAAILHYLGRATGLDCDCEELHRCEVIVQGVEDARSKLSKMLYDPEFSVKDRAEYLKDVMPMWMGYFEKLAPTLEKQDESYFSSNRLTWVDFEVFDYLENNVNFASLDLGSSASPVNALADFPKLANFYRQFTDRSSIAKYIHSKRRFPYKIPKTPSGAKPKVAGKKN